MIKTLTELVDSWESIAGAMERMLSEQIGMVAFDHCITLVGGRFLITIIVQLHSTGQKKK